MSEQKLPMPAMDGGSIIRIARSIIEFSFGPISVPDLAIRPPVVVGDADMFRVGATATIPSATLDCVAYLLNSSGLPVSVITVAFVSGTSPDLTTSPYSATSPGYCGFPVADMWCPLAGATSLAIRVTAISAGEWSLNGVAR